jgi:hypothetical protein
MNTLAELTSKLEEICRIVEESDTLPDNLLEIFADAKLAHTAKLDNYIGYIKQLENMSAFYSSRAEKLKSRAKTADRILERLKERLTYSIGQAPDLPWKSTEGDRFTLCNGQDSLQLDVSFYKTSYNYCLHDVGGIDPQFIDIVMLYCLNANKIKKHLKEGNTLPWARLEKKPYLRIT